MSAGSLILVNERTDAPLAAHVEVAVTRATRRTGLLGRSTFADSSALVIAPCLAVHTMFMQFSIDVVFVNREGRALRVVPNLAPWRLAMEPFAHAVIELPAGRALAGRVRAGDRLVLRNGRGEQVGLSARQLLVHGGADREGGRTRVC